jgi:NaMN:DMB phosphoribosyltransferase
MTTAATGLASGDLGAAMAANPFVLLLAGFTLVMAVLMAARAIGRVPGAAQWPASRRRQSYWLAAVLVAASWVFQLHRFGWV